MGKNGAVAAGCAMAALSLPFLSISAFCGEGGRNISSELPKITTSKQQNAMCGSCLVLMHINETNCMKPSSDN